VKTWRSDDGRVVLYCADCREVLPTLDPVETCITDPPYGLKFMGKEWDHREVGVYQDEESDDGEQHVTKNGQVKLF